MEVTPGLIPDGWETKTLFDLPAVHLRNTGTKERSIWRARFDGGLQAYAIGYSALYMLARGVCELGRRPYLSGSLLWMAGYSWALLNRNGRVVPPEFVRYMRQEQHRRLWRSVWRLE